MGHIVWFCSHCNNLLKTEFKVEKNWFGDMLTVFYVQKNEHAIARKT